ncbi:EI24 domain-containing protein [Falsirhodobacter sp. alg1]|uniref:EI24 domain-containing protein n=1 Tax=Falsirhodobacter sp. alg1 TaxID=1472418 RepID=UPI00128EB950|nr:EI24 domain-containing protein [Falsirhodobacter sp. alg1]
MFGAFYRALSQVFDRRFRSVLLRGIGLTVLLLVALTGIFLWGLETIVPDTVTLPWIGPVGGLDWLAGAGGIAVMLVASVFLMVPVASAFTGLFLEEIAEAVEHRHYPSLPDAAPLPWREQLAESASAFALLIGANILALAVYAFAGPLAPVLFVALNGYLLGREFFTLVAMRRVGRAAAKRLHRKHVAVIWVAGALMAAPLSVPLVNLVIPVLGVATFTHIYHRLVR